jgi:8-oxo-dGTP diphosphatase
MILTTLCYIRKDNHTLMLKRATKDPLKENWNGLGGKFNNNESPTDCIKREIFEESGLIAINPILQALILWPKFDGINDIFCFLYNCYDFTGSLIPSCVEGSLHWILDNRLKELPMWEGDYIFLPWMIDNMKFSSEFTYIKGKFISHKVKFYEEENWNNLINNFVNKKFNLELITEADLCINQIVEIMSLM